MELIEKDIWNDLKLIKLKFHVHEVIENWTKVNRILVRSFVSRLTCKMSKSLGKYNEWSKLQSKCEASPNHIIMKTLYLTYSKSKILEPLHQLGWNSTYNLWYKAFKHYSFNDKGVNCIWITNRDWLEFTNWIWTMVRHQFLNQVLVIYF